MSKLFVEACAISDTCNNSIVLSIAWSGAARFVKSYESAGAKELSVYLDLCGFATMNTASDIAVTSSDVLSRLSTRPVESIPTANQIKRQKAAGKTDAEIKEQADYAFSKKMLKYNEEQAVIRRNKDEIIHRLDAALGESPAKKKLTQMANNIIASKVFIKLGERDATLTEQINSGYRADAAEQEQDIIWEFLDTHFTKAGQLIAA